MDRYTIQEKVGSGNFAKVYRATDVYTKQEVALKLVDKKDLKNLKAISRVRTEMANMKSLSSHENVATLYDTFETQRRFGIIMEYIQGGELFDYVQKQEGMNENNAREVFKGIVEGVRHCHKHGIAHRDLKLENILLTKDGKPKIADFGFSKTISAEPLHSSMVGSLLYSSPEIVQGKPYQGPECDVWSLGVILYTMLTATMPFDDSNIGEFLNKIESGDYPSPVGVSDAAKDLISRMLNPNPITRYTLADIFNHSWMATLCKASSHTTKKTTRRRNGVSYNNSDAIRSALIKMNECECLCHKSDVAKHGRDSVFTKHCKDCDDVQANDPEIMLRRQFLLSRNSSISSGYGSELGSQYLQTPSPDDKQMNMLGFNLFPVIGGRKSVPRKSSASTIKGDGSFQRNSVPVRAHTILQECDSNDEDDIVFV